MKKIALFLALICTGSTVFANSSYELVQAYCKGLSQIAEMSMTARQYDAPAYETTENILEIISNAGGNDHMKDVSSSIIENAYKRPIIKEKELRKVLIDSFKDSYYFTCINAIKDKK